MVAISYSQPKIWLKIGKNWTVLVLGWGFKCYRVNKLIPCDRLVKFPVVNLSTFPNQPTFAALWLNPGQ